MRLSEAIRTGAQLRPQAFGAFFRPRRRDGRLGSCALGAAIDGAELISDPWDRHAGELLELLRAEWPELGSDRCDLVEALGSTTGPVVDAITAANDALEMTRERIADVLAAHGL